MEVSLWPSDKYHSVPSVSARSITRSKTKIIQQAFILHLQNWIDLIEEGPFEASEVNICMVEVREDVACT